ATDQARDQRRGQPEARGTRVAPSVRRSGTITARGADTDQADVGVRRSGVLTGARDRGRPPLAFLAQRAEGGQRGRLPGKLPVGRGGWGGERVQRDGKPFRLVTSGGLGSFGGLSVQ